MEDESDSDTNCIWYVRYSHQRTGTGTWGLWNRRTRGDHPNNSISEIGNNTEKSPGDLRRLAVTRATVKNHRLTLLWKTRNRVTWGNKPESIDERRKIKEISTKSKTIQTKQDIPKQWKKILPTSKKRWHKNIPTTGCKRSRTILD